MYQWIAEISKLPCKNSTSTLPHLLKERTELTCLPSSPLPTDPQRAFAFPPLLHSPTNQVRCIAVIFSHTLSKSSVLPLTLLSSVAEELPVKPSRYLVFPILSINHLITLKSLHVVTPFGSIPASFLKYIRYGHVQRLN